MKVQAILVPPCEADVQFYRTMLHELIELGVGLARDVCSQAKAEPSQALPDAAVMFERVSRAVRRTIALAQRLGEPVAAPVADAARRLARRRIVRQVEDLIQLKAEGPEREDCLRAELYERMDGPELEEELDLRPAAEIIADICRDLGLAAMSGTRPWMRRTPADIVALCARAARPSGLAARVAEAVAPAVTAVDAPAGAGVAGDEDEADPAVSVEWLLRRPSRDRGSG